MILPDGDQFAIHNCDNLHPTLGLPGLPDASVDAIVTDPPAGIAFMGKGWDSDKGGRDQWIAWLAGVMRECLRVLKPGGHALVWALPRTSHWTATAIEDAGFEIRDVVMHLFGTGFPKSLDVSKAIDKAAGAEREIVGAGRWAGREGLPSSTAARQWSGWGTALKPAAEHWILARKSLDGTVAANVIKHGTGALNIDATRIGTTKRVPDSPKVVAASAHTVSLPGYAGGSGYDANVGRWPANVTLDEDAARALDEHSGTTPPRRAAVQVHATTDNASMRGGNQARLVPIAADAGGGASRFFYVAKGSRSEKTNGGTVNNKHPTVKSIALMRWLVRLITPPGGLVLDPFMGSGSTGVAALAEGCRFLGMEREAEYADVAAARLGLIEP